MTRHIAILLPAAAALLMAACADEPPARQETPHHYSVDRYGNRLACYPMGASHADEEEAARTEYECLPDGGYGYGYRPYAYDPFWEFGLFYGWYWPYNTIIIQNPSPNPPRRPKDPPRYSRSHPSDRTPPSAPPSRDRSPPSRRPDR